MGLDLVGFSLLSFFFLLELFCLIAVKEITLTSFQLNFTQMAANNSHHPPRRPLHRVNPYPNRP